jgi:ankyrin repeat protein
MGTRKPSRPKRSEAAQETASLFLAAVRKGDLRRLRTLLTAHPDLIGAKADDGSSAVLVALYHRQLKVAEFLRTKGAVLSIYDAAAAGDRDRVEQLLAEDPRLIGFMSHDGWTPLHLAAFFGHPEVVDFLLEHGADMHVVSKNASSVMPLHSALANRQTETAILLIERGADIEARQTSYEYTPLHYAAANGLESIVQRLLNLGAKTTVEGLDGKKPFDLAKENGHHTIVELLGGFSR